MLPIALSLFVVVAVALYLGSRLIRLEYETHFDIWVDDGKPSDFFAQVPGSFIARMGVLIGWAFMTPDWMKSEPGARKMLLWYRVLFFVFIAGWILLVYLQSKRS